MRARELFGGKRDLQILFIGLVLVGAAVCGLFLLRISVLRSAAQEETRRYLDEISQRIVETVNSRVEASFFALEATAEVYSTLPEGEEADDYLRTIAQQYGFLRMGVAKRGGPLVTTDGHTVPVEALEGVQSALNGVEQATDLSISPIDGAKIVVFDVPMWKNGHIVGALTAVNAQETLRDYLGVESFNGEGFSGIINGRGDIIVTTANRHATASIENFFDVVDDGVVSEGYALEAMLADVAERKSGVLDYTLSDGVRKIMCYVPLKVSDWYLLSVVPYEVVDESARSYTVISEWVDAAIVALFLALVAVVLYISWSGQRSIERVAFVDGVTGGMNRSAFEREAGALLAVAPAGSYALVSMDIQGFKLVNETFGSEAGDKTLAYVHSVIKEQLAEGELVGRIGGDVFSLLLKYSTRQAMEKRMELLGERINYFNLELNEKHRYYLPVLQGVYVVEDCAQEVITIQDRANVARKSNKRARLGRLNTCTFYDDLYQEQLRREKDIDNHMESALKNGEFVIYLQPKVELRWNSVAGAEALVRWQDPERGLVQPDEFIPLFERSGFIVKLDRYVFEQVCMLQRQWLDAGRKPVVVSLNISRSNVADPTFLDEYVRIKEEYRIPDGLLELELTETLFLENELLLLALMERIQRAGFLCSLDDFGSGYSTLSLLRVIPADIIKLDKVFFRGAEHDQRSDYVIQSILELARRLKIQTVCEGVEYPYQLQLLQRFQCDMVQGFVFSGPVPVEEFEALAFSGLPLLPKELVLG